MSAETEACGVHAQCSNQTSGSDEQANEASGVNDVERANQSLLKKEALKARRREDKVIGNDFAFKIENSNKKI